MPIPVSLPPSLCDVSAVGSAIDSLDMIEQENRETFDLRIGRLWVIADSFITDQIVDDEPERNPNNVINKSSIAKIEEFIIHLSTVAASTIIATSSVLLYNAPSSISHPPESCSWFVSRLWKDFTSRLSEKICSRQMAEENIWLCSGTADRLAIKIPFSGSTSVSVQIGSVFCSWNPSILDLVWVISESVYVDFLTTRRWPSLVVEVRPYTFRNHDVL